MIILRKILLCLFCIGILFFDLVAVADDTGVGMAADKIEKQRLDKLKEEERQRTLKQLYEHMAREGIRRDLVEAIGAVGGHASVQTFDRRITPASSYSKIAAHLVLKPGEHYRFELDDYILSMQVPDAHPGSSWIVPYVDSRTDPERTEVFRKGNGLQVANLDWNYGTGIWPLFFGWQGIMSASISYRYLKPEEKIDFSTPENLQQISRRIQKNMIPSQAEIDDAIREHMILNRAGNKIYLDPEPVVINGRVWIRRATNKSYDRIYSYVTSLQPDRMLGIAILMPQFDYNGNPDLSTYPSALKRAFAQMEAMIASLRVTRVNDPGEADPFVIEHVEPAPLPVRGQ